jgi:hypothetical protein
LLAVERDPLTHGVGTDAILGGGIGLRHLEVDDGANRKQSPQVERFGRHAAGIGSFRHRGGPPCMSDTENETYHRGTANGNSRIGVLFKNFYFGLIIAVNPRLCRGTHKV